MTAFDWVLLAIPVLIALLILFAFLRRPLEEALNTLNRYLDQYRDSFMRSLRTLRNQAWSGARGVLDGARPDARVGEERTSLGRVLSSSLLLAGFWIIAAIADLALTLFRFNVMSNQPQPSWMPDSSLLGASVFLATISLYAFVWSDVKEFNHTSILYSRADKRTRDTLAWFALGGFAVTVLAAVFLAINSAIATESVNGDSASISLLWILLLIGGYGGLFMSHECMKKLGHVVGAASLAVFCLVVILLMGVVLLAWAILRVAVFLIKVVFVYILGIAGLLLDRKGGSRGTARPPQNVRLVTGNPGKGRVFDSEFPVTTTMDTPRFRLTFAPEHTSERLSAYQARVRSDGEIVWDSGILTVDQSPVSGGTLDIDYSGKEPLPKATVLSLEIRIQEVPSGQWSSYSSPIEFVLFSEPDVAILPTPNSVDAAGNSQVRFSLFYVQAEDQPATTCHLVFQDVEGSSAMHYDDGVHKVPPFVVGTLTSPANPGQKSLECDRHMGTSRIRLGTGKGAEFATVTGTDGAGPITHFLEAPVSAPHAAGSPVGSAITTHAIPLDKILGETDTAVVCVATLTSTPAKVKSAPFEGVDSYTLSADRPQQPPEVPEEPPTPQREDPTSAEDELNGRTAPAMTDKWHVRDTND